MSDDSASATGPFSADRSPRDVTIATAGHVDHGKSTLIRVLTGSDPDRLPEERRREMTIELGFASLPRPDGGRLAFIDVPGHERLVETMVAGVGSIDAALLVIAADDGPMPQTIEHLSILSLLGVDAIIVAMTRTDLVDEDWLDLASAETRQLLDGYDFRDAPIIPVSATTGAGLDDLRDELLAVPPRTSSPDEYDAVWLPIDRAFHLRGFGTVVAGTLSSGQLHRGDTVTIWPGGLRSTIRQLQSHNEVVETAFAGQRVAVNLAGIDLNEVRRGNVVSNQPVPAVDTVDIQFSPVGAMPTSGERVRVVVGTDRIDAAIQLVAQPDTTDPDPFLARLRFRRPVATRVGDRLIVRRPSPSASIGGGVVLARYTGRPPRLDLERRPELAALARGDPEPTLRRRLATGPVPILELTADLPGSVQNTIRQWHRDGSVRLIPDSPSAHGRHRPTARVLAEASWRTFIQELKDNLASYHVDTPETWGCPLSEIRRRSRFPASDLDDLLQLAVEDGQVVRRDGIIGLPDHRPSLRPSEHPVAERLLQLLGERQSIRMIHVSETLPTTIDFLERSGTIVRIRDDRVMASAGFEQVASWVIEASRSRPLDLATVRDRIGLGRDNVQRLLERLDDMGLTARGVDGRRRSGPTADEWLLSRTGRLDSRIGVRSGVADRGIIAP